MPTTVGVFIERIDLADVLWSQCDGPMGRHADLIFQRENADADHIFCFGTPWSGSKSAGIPRLRRTLAKIRGEWPKVRTAHAWERFKGRDPETINVLFGDPPPAVEEVSILAANAVTRRTFAPDPRASRPIVLPVTYHVHEPVDYFRQLSPPQKPVQMACVTSGAAVLPGHHQRMAFLRKLRAAGVEFELFGRGVPGDLRPSGPLRNKSAGLMPAKFALVIENYAEGDLYVTEKLWDALMCWCVPIYFGSRAADGLIPSDSFIRLPDLDDRGVEVVRRTLADPGLYERLLPAVAVARQRPMGDLRLVEWLRRAIAGDLAWPPNATTNPAARPVGV